MSKTSFYNWLRSGLRDAGVTSIAPTGNSNDPQLQVAIKAMKQALGLPVDDPRTAGMATPEFVSAMQKFRQANLEPTGSTASPMQDGQTVSGRMQLTPPPMTPPMPNMRPRQPERNSPESLAARDAWFKGGMQGTEPWVAEQFAQHADKIAGIKDAAAMPMPVPTGGGRGASVPAPPIRPMIDPTTANSPLAMNSSYRPPDMPPMPPTQRMMPPPSPMQASAPPPPPQGGLLPPMGPPQGATAGPPMGPPPPRPMPNFAMAGPPPTPQPPQDQSSMVGLPGGQAYPSMGAMFQGMGQQAIQAVMQIIYGPQGPPPGAPPPTPDQINQAKQKLVAMLQARQQQAGAQQTAQTAPPPGQAGY